MLQKQTSQFSAGDVARVVQALAKAEIWDEAVFRFLNPEASTQNPKPEIHLAVPPSTFSSFFRPPRSTAVCCHPFPLRSTVITVA